MKINKYKVRNLIKAFLLMPVGLVAASALTACSDFLDQNSDRVIIADKDHLNSAEDTLYSVLGVVNKMQSIADRTILLGEMRGDLSDVTTKTSADLRDVALFNVKDTTNAYNKPADYYAVINNCNYFIAKADTALKNNRNEYIFRKEFAAVKAFRAWTYMQLAQVYGRVPFVTEPILSNADADKDYPKYDMQQICEYFLNDLKGLENIETPSYGTIRSIDSRLFYYPIYVLEGDMNLWLGRYREAALCYYRYITTRNGNNGAYPTQTASSHWFRDDTHWQRMTSSWTLAFQETSYSRYNELITTIPGDSIPSEGNYSQLRNLFTSTDANGFEVSIMPSQSLINLSADQVYCHVTSSRNVIYAPKGLDNFQTGDLRLPSVFEVHKASQAVALGGKTINLVYNEKYTERNVNILRLTQVYLRMAEALNRAGFPRFAFEILKEGVNDEVIQSKVIPYYKADSAWIAQFSFPSNLYVLRTTTYPDLTTENTIGIHSHGSGYTEVNDYYTLPDDTTLTGDARLQYQVEHVEDLLVDEEALEFAFEGQRFGDLMRVALRRGDPAYLADRVYGRRGPAHVAEMKALIGRDLYQTSNWYLPLP